MFYLLTTYILTDPIASSYQCAV